MSLIIKSLLGQRDQFNVSKFRAQLNSFGGPASNSSFFVRINTPRSLLTGNYVNAALDILSEGAKFFDRRVPLTFDYQEKAVREIPRDLQFLAHSAPIPGKTIQTIEENSRYIAGSTKMPTSLLFDDLTISFYARSGMLERIFFELWQQSIITSLEGKSGEDKKNIMDDVRKTINDEFSSLIASAFGKDGKAETAPKKTQAAIRNNTVGYYGDYITEIELLYFNPDGEKTFKVKFFECYPTLVTPVQLDWASQNEVIKLNVNFSYRNYEMEAIQPGDVKRAAYFAKGLGEGNLRQAASSIFQVAKSL